MEAGFQIEMTRVYVEMADYNHALELIDELDRREDLLDHQRIELLVQRTECLIQTKKYEVANGLLVHMLNKQLAQQTIDDQTFCDLFNKLGTAHFFLRDFEKAFSAYEQAYRISQKLHEYGLISAKVSYNLGITCNQLGYKDDATRYLEKAYLFFDSISDMNRVAQTLFELAIASGNPSQLVQARSLFESLNMVHQANRVKQHYAFHIQSRQDYKKAVDELYMVATEFEQIGDVGMSVYTYSRATMVCLEYDDLEQASECLNEATLREQKMANKENYPLAYYFRARSKYFLCNEQYENCILDSRKSAEIYGIMGMDYESADSLQLAAEAFRRKGDYQEAFEVSQKSYDRIKKLSRGNQV
ncbi:tetratricopeptide repeat protein [Tumebacillus permanentifrigoris]|uniref:Tetratricopeptide repeat protein n=2 Tax=Tumebacillus permanentifrigoris TaxID=378543 RepID=A0A316D4X8_9BACL|nr:tetratricopeptide repeat protein [Tumebacillus permanentifrigoris]